MSEAQLNFIEAASENSERLVSAFVGKYELNYSEESLSELDSLLEDFSDFADQDDEEMKSDFIAQAGSYIFEVARRIYGGKYYWYDPLDQPIFVTGQPNFEISFLAFEKIKGRIENGAEDNIPYFFKGYTERIKNAKPGDKAMIV
ncbi:MAG: hypothetical protein IAF38_07080 [Bacteroidia bacterium]|nr:hypothetical protein [Bacteroidia bacterium]